ncbi:hypothetical protein [Nonomuraea insulae]|uniref:Transmembrane protein n=1 Tax=Nonomuraea insulae TaxID=1616787 RepID=A0ABW1CA50_9ACTN
MESNAVEGLAVIAEARAALADRLITPWWYHPIYGLLMAGCILAFGLGGAAVKIGGVALLAAGCVVLTRAYRRLIGVWVSGLEAGPAGRWLGAMGAVVVLGVVASVGFGALTDLRWPVWCLAMVGFAATIVLRRRFDTALQAHLRAGA